MKLIISFLCFVAANFAYSANAPAPSLLGQQNCPSQSTECPYIGGSWQGQCTDAEGNTDFRTKDIFQCGCGMVADLGIAIAVGGTTTINRSRADGTISWIMDSKWQMDAKALQVDAVGTLQTFENGVVQTLKSSTYFQLVDDNSLLYKWRNGPSSLGGGEKWNVCHFIRMR